MDGNGSRGNERSDHRKAVCVARIAALFCVALVLGLGCARELRADEIRLKDGNKLYGVIVAYEDNMFKVRTPFGYVLVEKDKIAAIVPSTIGAVDSKEDNEAASKMDAAATTKDAGVTAKRSARAKPAANSPATADSSASSAPDTGTAVAVSEKTADPAIARREKTSAILANSAVKPEVPAKSAKKIVAPALRPVPDAPANGVASSSSAMPPPPPKEIEVSPEEIRGNLYINHANHFSIYKAPSWNLIEDARKALPDAIVAMGTFNESTLLVVGKEKNKEPLEPAAAGVERRVREVYDNYRQISRRSTTVGGLPGVEFRYRGVADEHDWSGTLAVITRGDEIFTILGMTYADSDLIQIQENVIARAIASLDFAAGNAPLAK
jgi:hypothetical protein